MAQAEIVQFQKKQEAKFICSACGADRACDCNAPAVQKLAEMKEKNRVSARESMRRKRLKNQSAVNVNSDDAAIDGWENDNPELTREELWSNSFQHHAGEAIAMTAYWRKEFGDFTKFPITTELLVLAQEAAHEWERLATMMELLHRENIDE